MPVKKIGIRIRKFREAQDMTIEKLAETTGLGLDFLVALEEESLYPSIGPLQKVAQALQVRLGTLIDDVACSDPIVTRATNREADLSMQHTSDKKAAYTYFSLGKGKVDRNMEPFYLEITPEPEEDRKMSSHEGEEFIIVVSGTLLVMYGNESHVLKAGDTIYYNSIVPHYVGAIDGQPSTIYATFYRP